VLNLEGMNARVQRDPQSTDTSLFVNAKKKKKEEYKRFRTYETVLCLLLLLCFDM
jgi:hypothetical protein